jgi:hypothetical protein
MAGHVAVGQVAVLGLQQDVACAADQNRAERVIAVAAGALRNGERVAQECLVIERRFDGVHFPNHLR